MTNLPRAPGQPLETAANTGCSGEAPWPPRESPDGALFGCGDMHAAMGDGEISVSGAEAAGWATVTLEAVSYTHLRGTLTTGY